MNKSHNDYVDEHREERLEYLSNYGKTHHEERKKYQRENPDKIIAWRRKYYSIPSNRDKVVAKVKEYRENNKEIVKERRQRYFKTPSGRMAKARDKHRRRALEKQTEQMLTAKQWQIILDRQENKCNGYPTGTCNIKFTEDTPATRDHIVPVSKKGKFTFENTQALCGLCNSKKHNKLDHTNIVTWLTQQ